MPPPLPHYEVHPGRGPYLLLVHGVISSREQWCLNLAELAEVSRPVVVELLGHGRSPAPAELAAYHPDRYVEAFEQIRAELGAERWIALGQSLGGPSEPVVGPGDKVTKGDLVARIPEGKLGSNLHASIGGTVSAVVEDGKDGFIVIERA